MSDDPAKPLILIADDDAEMRRMVRRSLTPLKVDFLEAKDGEDTLSLVIEHQPDLIVLDVMMPTLSGWEICKYVRSKPEYEGTIIVMLTAIGKTVNEMTSPLYGADAYLDKPFDIQEMVETVQRLLKEQAAR